MSVRMRQGNRPRAGETSQTLRSSTGRDTRHAAIATYAEPPSDDEALVDEYDDEEYDDGSDHNNVDPGDSDDVDGVESDSVDDDDENDLDFGAGRRPSKRPTTDDTRSLRSGPVKRRRLSRHASSAKSRATAVASASTVSHPSPRTRRQSGRRNTASRQRNSLNSFISDDRHEKHAKHAKRTARPSRSHPPHTPTAGFKSRSSGKLASPASAKKLSPAKKLDWEKLPYMVMVSIFEHASDPLDNVESARWLAAALRTCRSFTEPALRVLYIKPPLLSMKMAHGLLDMLSRKRVKPMYAYHSKITSLSIDVDLVSLSYKGRRLDLGALVKQCPRLAHMNLYHSSDGPPYRNFGTNMRFRYPTELFEVLGTGRPIVHWDQEDNPVQDADGQGQDEDAAPTSDRSGAARDNLGVSQDLIIDEPRKITRLASWRWNAHMFTRYWRAKTIQYLHKTDTFAGLTKVTYVNFPRMSVFLPSLLGTEAGAELDRLHTCMVADSINELAHLKHLVMKTCAVLDDVMLPMLPANLEHLELVCCDSLAAKPFAEFLVTHGQHLRTMTLNSNRMLSLEFLMVLGSACPNLEELRMNLTYYSRLQLSGDSKPDYERLFTAEQVPTWPKSIRVIVLENLRHWDAPAAEMFFQSLVDSAPDIPHLRVLKIKAMLNIPWRQRSALRDKWVHKLNQVFKRQIAPPQPAYSMKHYNRYVQTKKLTKALGRAEVKALIRDVTAATGVADTEALTAEKPLAEATRRSSRFATGAGPSLTSQLDHIASSKRLSYREPDTDEDEGGNDDDEEEEEEDEDEDGEEEEEEEDKPVRNTSSRRPVFNMDSACGNGDDITVYNVERPFVHGMCDVVNVKFDNQKPVELQYTMDDFEDTEPDTEDDDWTG